MKLVVTLVVFVLISSLLCNFVDARHRHRSSGRRMFGAAASTSQERSPASNRNPVVSAPAPLVVQLLPVAVEPASPRSGRRRPAPQSKDNSRMQTGTNTGRRPSGGQVVSNPFPPAQQLVPLIIQLPASTRSRGRGRG